MYISLSKHSLRCHLTCYLHWQTARQSIEERGNCSASHKIVQLVSNSKVAYKLLGPKMTDYNLVRTQKWVHITRMFLYCICWLILFLFSTTKVWSWLFNFRMWSLEKPCVATIGLALYIIFKNIYVFFLFFLFLNNFFLHFFCLFSSQTYNKTLLRALREKIPKEHAPEPTPPPTPSNRCLCFTLATSLMVTADWSQCCHTCSLFQFLTRETLNKRSPVEKIRSAKTATAKHFYSEDQQWCFAVVVVVAVTAVVVVFSIVNETLYILYQKR